MRKVVVMRRDKCRCESCGFLNEYCHEFEAEKRCLEAQNFALRELDKEMQAENAAAFSLLDVYEKENERLMERLNNYTVHRIGCSLTPCDCGLDALKEGE